MKKITFFLILLGISILNLNAQGTLTALQVLDKTSAVLTNPKGIDSKFTISGNGANGSGIIKTLGGKFNVKLPDVEIWYNGNDLFTYNKRSDETTVVYPTAEELAESNPLAYVYGAKKNYNVAYSTVKKNDRYVLELTPNSKRADVKRITLTIRSKDFVPEKMVLEPRSGSPVTIEISSCVIGSKAVASDFEYPKSKYPKAEIVDLR